MKHNNLRAGFTLVELMVFFLFISILIAASTPLITKRIKSVPLRTYHGKFLCYRDGAGTLHGDYYNAAGDVVKSTTGSGDSITFEPPKRAAVFKVEMVGAGAGGYDYTDYKNESNPMHKSYFNKDGDGGHSGDTVYELSDSDIKNRLQGQRNTISAYTGKGGDAGSITYRYSVPSLMITRRAIASVEKDSKTHFLYYDVDNFNSSTMSKEWTSEGEGGINTKAKIEGPYKQFQQYAASQYPDIRQEATVVDASKNAFKRQLEYTATTTVQSDLRGKAKGTYELDNIYRIPVSSYTTVEGGKGGKGNYISYTYTIDFNSAEAKGKTPQEYIKWLMNTYQSGMSYYPANEMYYWHFYSGRSVSDGSDGSNKTASISSAVNGIASGSSKEGTAAIAGDGGDANGYAALQIGYHKYLTNKQKATGGKDTRMYVDAKGPIMLEYKNGFDADSLGMIDSDGNTYSGSGSGSSNGAHWSTADTSSTKYIELISTVPVRTYYIGAKGESGKYISKQVANLGKQCTITLPPAGQSNAIAPNTDVDDLAIADTTFTCQGWKNALVASSARPTTNCQTTDGGSADCDSSASFPTYNPYANLSESDRFTGTGFVELPSFKEIIAQIAASSQFGAIGSVFTKTPSLAEYGKGGNGAGYKDLCMKMGGQINIKTMDSRTGTVSSADPIYFPYEYCSMSNNPRTEATAGGQGAIIISW